MVPQTLLSVYCISDVGSDFHFYRTILLSCNMCFQTATLPISSQFRLQRVDQGTNDKIYTAINHAQVTLSIVCTSIKRIICFTKYLDSLHHCITFVINFFFQVTFYCQLLFLPNHFCFMKKYRSK